MSETNIRCSLRRRRRRRRNWRREETDRQPAHWLMDERIWAAEAAEYIYLVERNTRSKMDISNSIYGRITQESDVKIQYLSIQILHGVSCQTENTSVHLVKTEFHCKFIIGEERDHGKDRFWDAHSSHLNFRGFLRPEDRWTNFTCLIPQIKDDVLRHEPWKD